MAAEGKLSYHCRSHHKVIKSKTMMDKFITYLKVTLPFQSHQKNKYTKELIRLEKTHTEV